jgi:hypothetical protein
MRFSVALKSDGTAVAWGEKATRQTMVPYLGKAKTVAAGYFHTLAVRSDGTVIGWGSNAEKQCTPPRGLTGVVGLAAGWGHSVALKADGTLVGWGGSQAAAIAFPAGFAGVRQVSAVGWQTLVVRDPGDFRSVKVGTMAERTFTIRNTGSQALTGIGLTISGTDAAFFAVTAQPAATTAAANGLLTFTVRFTPGAIGGQRNAVLTVASNDPDSPAYTIPLTGFGEQAARPEGTPGAVFTASVPRLEPATGLHVQTVSYKNNTGVPLNGLAVRVPRLTPWATLLGASEGAEPGSVDVVYSKPIANGEKISLTLCYVNLDPSAVAAILAPASRYYSVGGGGSPLRPDSPLAIFLADPEPPPALQPGTLIPLTRCVNATAGPLLTWNTVPGSDYVVEYSADNLNWLPAAHLLRAQRKSITWIDHGPPETISKPKGKANGVTKPPVGSRYYRVKKL